MKRAIPILLILILAALLRVRGIGHDSLWGDESLTVYLARMNLHDLVKYDTWYEQIPPLHHIIVHFWIPLFGRAEASVRMPSAIAGVAAVLVFYVLVARLMGRRVALPAALLLAVSPMHIAYSQECRAYALSALLGLISCDLFVRALRRPTQTLLAAYVIVATLMMYTHVYGAFTLLAQNLIYAGVLLHRRRRGKRWARRGRGWLAPSDWLAAQVAVVLLYGPWIPIVMKWTRMIQRSFWVQHISLDDITRSYYVFSGSVAAFVAVLVLCVLAAAYHLPPGRRRHVGAARARHPRVPRPRRFGLATLLTLTLVPVITPIAISLLTRPAYTPRYAILSAVAMCGVAAAGLAALRPAPLRLVVLVALAVAMPLGTAARIPRGPFRVVGDFLNRNMRPTDLAVIHLRVGTRLYDYYVDRPEVARRGIDAPTVPVSLPMDGRRVWLIMYDFAYTPQQIMGRAPWRIERRKYTPGVMALELTDEPWPDGKVGIWHADPAPAPPPTIAQPTTAPSTTAPLPTTAPDVTPATAPATTAAPATRPAATPAEPPPAPASPPPTPSP